MIRLDAPFVKPTDALQFCKMYETAEVRTQLDALRKDGSLTDKQRKAKCLELNSKAQQNIDWLTWLNEEEALYQTKQPLLAMALGMLAFDATERAAFMSALTKLNERIRLLEEAE